MKKDIILGGVGGQGILSIAAIIGTAAVAKGLFMKQSEVHGMSQRGGDVMSNLRISDKEIFSDLIPNGKADIVIAIEPMEGLRYIHQLSEDGWLISNTKPYINIPNYPSVEKVISEVDKVKHHVSLDADQIAKDLGNIKVANVVILGAACPFLGFEFQDFENAIRMIFGKKGDELVQLNLSALKAGQEIAQKFI